MHYLRVIISSVAPTQYVRAFFHADIARLREGRYALEYIQSKYNHLSHKVSYIFRLIYIGIIRLTTTK